MWMGNTDVHHVKNFYHHFVYILYVYFYMAQVLIFVVVEKINLLYQVFIYMYFTKFLFNNLTGNFKETRF